jgi:hypothetical protein
MPTGFFQLLAQAAFAALITMSWMAAASAATAIDACGTLNTFGTTYVLSRDLTSCGTCLVVASDRVTIDLAGHAIVGSCDGDGVTDDRTRWHGTTVKNGTITGFAVGISLGSSTRTLIRNLESSANSLGGILAGDHALVKGCVIKDNGENGIIIGDFGQVEDCVVAGHLAPEGSGGFGIFGASHVLITGNTVVNNVSGILAGDFSTIAFNTASTNLFFGLLVGNHALVTGNTTNANGDVGIATGSRSTVSRNTANGNGAGIDVGLGGFFDGRWSLVTGNTTIDNEGAGVEVRCPSTVTHNTSSGNVSNYAFNGPGCHTPHNK